MTHVAARCRGVHLWMVRPVSADALGCIPQRQARGGARRASRTIRGKVAPAMRPREATTLPPVPLRHQLATMMTGPPATCA